MKKQLIFGTGLSAPKEEIGLYNTCSAAVDNGIYAFDTAPSYHTEEILGNVLNRLFRERGLSRSEFHIQTKIDPIQMYNGYVREYFLRKLTAMRLDYVDALLIHWPVHKYFLKTWNELQTIKKEGLALHIGICNLRCQHLLELNSIGVKPEILQIERHPLNTFQDEARYCHDNSIWLQDYSPLCKMHPVIRNSSTLLQMSDKYKRSIGQLILRWHIETGATPVFTSKKISRIAEYAQVDEFIIDQSDCSAISEMNINHKLYLESLICPGF